MESLSEAVKQLQKKAAEQAPGRLVDEQTRQQTQRLLEATAARVGALRALAQRELLYDADRNLDAGAGGFWPRGRPHGRGIG